MGDEEPPIPDDVEPPVPPAAMPGYNEDGPLHLNVACVRIAGDVVHETDYAVLLDTADGEVWLPFSQVEEIGDGEWWVARWLAKEHGLI